MIDPASRSHFDRHGWVHLAGVLSPSERQDLVHWTDEIAAWPERPGAWMRYYERPAAHGGARQLSRIENFVPYHTALASLLVGPRTQRLMAALLGEPAILFKDKINFKLPGGAGFTDHQDAPAYVDFGVEHHLTLAVPVDDMTDENGCLEMAYDAAERRLLPQLPDGSLRRDVMTNLERTPLHARLGDVAVFDAWVPHRSGPNVSNGPRRCYYLTFNPAAAGDLRDAYYARKRELFPPECERVAGVDYAARGRQFNLANPFD